MLRLWLVLILPSDKDADRTLVLLAIGGDERAKNQLARRLTRIVHKHVRRQLAQLSAGNATEEIAMACGQESWVKLWNHNCRVLRRFDPGLSSLDHYVGRIARGVTVDWCRRRRAKVRGGGWSQEELTEQALVTRSTPESQAETRQLMERLHAHLQEVLPHRGMLIYEALRESREPAQIAAALGVSHQVVYNWRFRIRRVARAFIDAL